MLNIHKVLGIQERPKLDVFSEGNIVLTDINIVYIETLGGWVKKSLTFGDFKRHAAYYSEFMTTPCSSIIKHIEVVACMNATKSKLAKTNLL